MPNRKKIFLIISLLYIVYTIFPLFSDIVHLPVWLPSLLSFIVILLLYPKAFLNRTVYWFIAYAGVLFIYFLGRHPLAIGIGSVGDAKKLLIEYAYILPTISIFSVLIYLNDFKLTQLLINLSIVILFA